MKNIFIYTFILLFSSISNVSAKTLFCVADSLMKVKLSNTEIGHAKPTTKNTETIQILKDKIIILNGKDKIEFRKVLTDVYASGYGVIITHPENDLRIVMNIYRPSDNTKEKIIIETISYNCNEL